MSTVYQAFRDTSRAAPDKACLHIPLSAARYYAAGPVDFSYGEALAAVEDCARGYRERGYASPLRVALLLENRAEFFIHWLALNSLGCSVVPVSGELTAPEIAYFLEHSEAAAVVSVPEKITLLQASLEHLARKPALVSCAAFEQLPDARGDTDASVLGTDTECALLYTSGSTGKPKACVLGNGYFTAFGTWYQQLGGLGAITWGEERLLTPLPLTHMNAMAVSAMAMLMNAGCIVQLDRFHPASWWQSVRESNATIVHYLGVLPAILLQLPASTGDDFSRQVKFGFGAGVNPQHHARFEQRFGFPLIESWAMTECGAGGAIAANKEPRHVGSCCFGKPGSQVEVQLVDANGQEVAAGETGELRVRGSDSGAFFSGYFKDQTATEEIWRDGWLNTGDLVRQSEDGSLHFVDRRKNIIRRSGENIAALEVEAALSLDSRIEEALVTAVPDELRGDEVAACIILKDGETPDEATANAIVVACLGRLAYFKAPGYIVFCDALPKTAANKPKRADLKAMARRQVAAGQCFDTRGMKVRNEQG